MEYIEHVDPPTDDEGWIEYALQLLWNETGHTYASDKAAAELAALRARLSEAEDIIFGMTHATNADEREAIIGEAKDYVKQYEVTA